MARKKNAKSLFEVITANAAKGHKADKSLGVPGWFGRAKSSQPSAPGPQAAAGAPTALPERPHVAPGPPAEPIFSIADGRLRISLSQTGAAVAALGLILLLFAAFFLGSRSSRGPAQAQGAPSAGQAPARAGTPLLPPERQEAGPEEGNQVPAVRQKGLWYLVIQAAVWTRQDAENIRDFLREKKVEGKGIYATVHRSRDHRWWMVRDLRGFRDRKSKEALAYQAGVEALGDEYKKHLRKTSRSKDAPLYDFRQCWFTKEQ